MAKKSKYPIVNNFYCTKCGNKGIPISRKAGKEKEPGHLKKLFCIYCNEEWNMVEIKPNDIHYTLTDFFNEYTYHNFDEEGNRIKPYKQFKEELRKSGVI